jgi:hypothetical protein
MNFPKHIVCGYVTTEWYDGEVRTQRICRRRATNVKNGIRGCQYHLYRKIKIAESKYESLKCVQCHRGDREELLMICDMCESGWHTDCLTNPLDEVPSGQFICDNCNSFADSEISSDSEDSDMPSPSNYAVFMFDMVRSGLEESTNDESEHESDDNL